LLTARLKPCEDTLGALALSLQTLPSVCWVPLAILRFAELPLFAERKNFGLLTPPKMASLKPKESVEWMSLLTTSLCINPSMTYALSRSPALKTNE
jgi:hypothetical protein